MKHTQHDRVDLRRPKGGAWRAVLNVLAKPATRVHNYRNLHSAMLQDAMSFYDAMTQPKREDCE